MKDAKIIDITPENILEYGICGYKNLKREGYPEKISWVEKCYPQGLKIKAILTENDGVQGMIEYLPGEYNWRPVEAEGYYFIHCLFVGFKRSYKGKGYATMLINECINDAKQQNKAGIAVVTRKGSFMVGKEIFIKNGFVSVDKAPPDFELLIKQFKKNSRLPKFKGNWNEKLSNYQKGLTIIRANQCPYTMKNVNEIKETSKKLYGIQAKIVNCETYKEAQESPCAFGTFCIVYEGEIISYHPISNTRFKNIMNSILN